MKSGGDDAITTRNAVAAAVAKSLREFGYIDVTTAMIREVLDAWIAGKRDKDLPHGIVGIFAANQFEEAEEARPGALAKLK